MSKATLLVIQGVDQGARFEIGEAPAGLGRGVGNAIRVLDTEVSRQHATIRHENGAFYLTDEHSANGTFVNGEQILTRKLSNGDQIQVGRSVILFKEISEGTRRGADRIDLVATPGSDSSQILSEISSVQFAEEGQEARAESLANLQALYRISEEAVSPSISMEQLLKRVLDLTIEAVGADRGCILVSDPETGRIVPEVFSHARRIDESSRMPVSRSIVDYVLARRQGVRTSDARTDSRFQTGQSILQAGIREAMCVPLQGRYGLMGVIYVDITTPPERVILDGGARHRFREEHLRLLLAIGRQSALAVENNRYQQALVKAERLAAMGQTIAMLSHHIKNILQGVRGGSYLIDMGLKEHNEEFVQKGWSIVEKNQNKIYHLVMDMLTFSKERQPAMQTVSLNDTVAEVCELMQARAAECSATLECKLSPDVPLTTFDPEGIHRAILNIVINALDAVEGKERPKVRVETGYQASTDTVFVSVTDNGPGIPEEQLSKIFNIFESTKGARGTGLGLAVSQKIIREHGGKITVDSTPGMGCRFVLSWPNLDDEHRSGERQTMEEKPPTRKRR